MDHYYYITVFYNVSIYKKSRSKIAFHKYNQIQQNIRLVLKENGYTSYSSECGNKEVKLPITLVGQIANAERFANVSIIFADAKVNIMISGYPNLQNLYQETRISDERGIKKVISRHRKRY